MNIFEIQKLFQDEVNLDLVLEEFIDILETVDKYSRDAFKHQLDNPTIIDKALDVLQGCYGILEPVLAVADTEKLNREERYYCELKRDASNGEKKFVDSTAKKEASAYISEYRRIRNYLEGYVKVCDKAITVLQSRLKKADDPSKLNKGEK